MENVLHQAAHVVSPDGINSLTVSPGLRPWSWSALPCSILPTWRRSLLST